MTVTKTPTSSDTTSITRDLKSDQIGAYDTDFVDDEMFASIAACIDRDFPDCHFTFCDVGGGNGEFADRLLAAYPNATGVVLDNARQLIDTNAPHPRKRTVVANAVQLDAVLSGECFDIVFFNYALHHFIANDYRASRGIQRRTIAAAGRVLTSGGRISIIENMCTGQLPGNVSGRLIYELTSNDRLASIVKHLGANTAGTGVCFSDCATWADELEVAGFSVQNKRLQSWKNDLHVLKRTLLLIRDLRGGHLWAART